MSKLQFRARALDAVKPMPIYMPDELPDLTDYAAINRAVPQMPTGMEKEEESEHHLQCAIWQRSIIPTPEVSVLAEPAMYDCLYPANYAKPRQLIRMQPFAMEADIPDYDMDSDDELWVNDQACRLDLTPFKFESMMDRLEKSSGQTVVAFDDVKALLKEDDDLTIAVYDYWLNKRLTTQHPLILTVRTEHRGGSLGANNPYLAFRRRTEKMQTRKNRKNDEASYEKMLKLRRELAKALTLLEMVKRREKIKREHLHLTIEIVEKRCQARDYTGTIINEVNQLRTQLTAQQHAQQHAAAMAAAQAAQQRTAFSQLFANQYAPAVNQSGGGGGMWTTSGSKSAKEEPRREKRIYNKKRKHKNTTIAHNTTTPAAAAAGSIPINSRISVTDDDQLSNLLTSTDNGESESRYAFRRNKNCSYHMPKSGELGNWPWTSPEENGSADPRYRFTLTSIKHPKRRCIGFARRRVGRGGRVILDRVPTSYDDLWRKMDFTILERATPREQTALERILHGDTTARWLDSGDAKDDAIVADADVADAIVADGTVTDASRLSYNLLNEHNYNATVKVEAETDVKDELSHVKQEPGVVVDDVKVVGGDVEDTNAAGSSSIIDVCDIKAEQTTNHATDATSSLHLDDHHMLELLNEIKQQWLHFRPKTPDECKTSDEMTQLTKETDILNTLNDNQPVQVKLNFFDAHMFSDTASTFAAEFTLGDVHNEFNMTACDLVDDVALDSSGTSTTSLNDARVDDTPAFGCTRVLVADARVNSVNSSLAGVNMRATTTKRRAASPKSTYLRTLTSPSKLTNASDVTRLNVPSATQAAPSLHDNIATIITSSAHHASKLNTNYLNHAKDGVTTASPRIVTALNGPVTSGTVTTNVGNTLILPANVRRSLFSGATVKGQIKQNDVDGAGMIVAASSVGGGSAQTHVRVLQQSAPMSTCESLRNHRIYFTSSSSSNSTGLVGATTATTTTTTLQPAVMVSSSSPRHRVAALQTAIVTTTPTTLHSVNTLNSISANSLEASHHTMQPHYYTIANTPDQSERFVTSQNVKIKAAIQQHLKKGVLVETSSGSIITMQQPSIVSASPSAAAALLLHTATPKQSPKHLSTQTTLVTSATNTGATVTAAAQQNAQQTKIVRKNNSALAASAAMQVT